MSPSAFHRVLSGLACAAMLAFVATAFGGPQDKGGNAVAGNASTRQEVRAASDDDAAVTTENARLRHENELLRKESQSLRRQLVLLKNRVGGGTGANDDQADGKTGVDVGNSSDGLKHSLSTNRIRHNSSCRYYDPAPEKACGKNDGRPCKTCGG